MTTLLGTYQMTFLFVCLQNDPPHSQFSLPFSPLGMRHHPVHGSSQNRLHLRVFWLQGAEQHGDEAAGDPLRLRGGEQPRRLPRLQQRRLHAVPLHHRTAPKRQTVQLAVRHRSRGGQRPGERERPRSPPRPDGHPGASNQPRYKVHPPSAFCRQCFPPAGGAVPIDEVHSQEPLRRRAGPPPCLASFLPVLRGGSGDPAQ